MTDQMKPVPDDAAEWHPNKELVENPGKARVMAKAEDPSRTSATEFRKKASAYEERASQIEKAMYEGKPVDTYVKEEFIHAKDHAWKNRVYSEMSEDSALMKGEKAGKEYDEALAKARKAVKDAS